MKKTTGIGGIFFRVANPATTKNWYSKHLGLHTDPWGTNFEWRQADHPESKGFTQWSPMAQDSTHLPKDQNFMINYRVEDLEQLLETLRTDGVEICDELQEFDYGKFIHIIDCNGHKVELWEPNDVVYDKIVEGRTK